MSRRRLILSLVLMVLLPLGALGGLGVKLVRDGAALVARQADDLAAAELETVAAAVAAGLAARERVVLEALATLPEGGWDADEVRSWRRGRAELDGVLVVGRDGEVRFPPPEGPASEAERRFLERTRAAWDGGTLTRVAAGAGAAEGDVPDHGWYGWYHDGGLRLLLWRADGDRVVAAELSRVRLLADVVAALPETDVDDVVDGRAPARRTALLDTAGRVVYAWGGFAPEEDASPRASVSLAAPLGAWRIVRWTAPGAAAEVGGSLALGFGAGLGALALALFGLAAWLYSERTREMRLAEQRVSFVGQVSHELRTPLTNIRLYAELLADGLDPEADELDRERARQLEVVVEETRRLERLIGNVLSFARGQEGRLVLRPIAGVVDDVVRRALDGMGPTLAARGVSVDLDLAADAQVQLDPDALEQILANLLGNVAKYGAPGGHVAVTTRYDDGRAVVTVADDGPGVPAAHRERIFEPFHRVSDRVSDGVAGTGIGLDIARRLARLHGGDLRLVASERGACFELVIRVEPVGASEPMGEDR